MRSLGFSIQQLSSSCYDVLLCGVALLAYKFLRNKPPSLVTLPWEEHTANSEFCLQGGNADVDDSRGLKGPADDEVSRE